MIKKRGVVISTTDHAQTIAKSHSAHNNPLAKHYSLLPNSQSGAIVPLDNQALAQSNLISQDHQKMINNAHYTYDDPDNFNHIRYDDNQEYVIESMHKKEEMAMAKQKQELKRRIQEKKKGQKIIENKQQRGIKVKQSNRIAAVKSTEPKTKSKPFVKPSANKHKCNKPFCRQLEIDGIETIEAVPRKQLNTQRLKPRPLSYRVDMLDKGKMSSPGRKKAQDNQADLDVPQAARIHPKFQQSIRDYDEELALNENKNSRRLPFRFCE